MWNSLFMNKCDSSNAGKLKNEQRLIEGNCLGNVVCVCKVVKFCLIIE